jgi:hypothetical protein
MSDIPGAAGGNYASAAWDDSTDSSPSTFDIGGQGSSTPYSSAVNAILTKHMDEIKGKNTTNLPVTWKRRLRDFMGKKHNDLLDFLKLSVSSHPVFSPGEVLLRRFGNPTITSTHSSVRDMILDISGEDITQKINAELLILSCQDPLKDYVSYTQAIYEQYKEAGDELLKAQQYLKAKLDKLDRIQGKIGILFEIEPNEKYEPLMLANEEYLKKIFDETQIEEEYKSVIAAYRRFIALRDIVTMSRSITLQESEPLCSICLEEPVSFALSPCGHTFCQTCIRRQTGQCFMCRAQVKDRVKLYFG